MARRFLWGIRAVCLFCCRQQNILGKRLRSNEVDVPLAIRREKNTFFTAPALLLVTSSDDISETFLYLTGPLFIEELLLTSASGEGHGENSVLMRCKIDAWPAPTVSWFYKDEPLGDGNEAVDPDRVVLKSDGARGVFTLLLKEVEGLKVGLKG